MDTEFESGDTQDLYISWLFWRHNMVYFGGVARNDSEWAGKCYTKVILLFSGILTSTAQGH